MAKLSKEEIDLDLLDKQHQSLVDTRKTVRRLFITFFSLMLLILALAFEPEIFQSKRAETHPITDTQKTNISKDAIDSLNKLQSNDTSETPVQLFGLKVSRGAILKYSSLLLGMIYFLLAVYSTYLDYMRVNFQKSYNELYSITGNKDTSLVDSHRIPHLHTILGDLSTNHPRKGVQILFQILDFIRSFFLYVLPMVIVIVLLGEGVKRATSKLLIGLFFTSPIIVFIGTMLLTREWFFSLKEVLQHMWWKRPRLRKALRGQPLKVGNHNQKIKLFPLTKWFGLLGSVASIVGVLIAIFSSYLGIQGKARTVRLTAETDVRSECNKINAEIINDIARKGSAGSEPLSRDDFSRISINSNGFVEFSSLNQIQYDNLKVDKSGYMRAIVKEGGAIILFVQVRKLEDRIRVLVLKPVNYKDDGYAFLSLSYIERYNDKFFFDKSKFDIAAFDEERQNWREFVATMV